MPNIYSKIDQKLFKILPQWRIFAKSCHTNSEANVTYTKTFTAANVDSSSVLYLKKLEQELPNLVYNMAHWSL